jgi:hypothetical protein
VEPKAGATVTLKPGQAARGAKAKAKTLRVALKVTYTPTGGKAVARMVSVQVQ